tara:strand:- start:198 stop:1232 length:1035 start_codon:yes stop_codon:yes gene_type:complete
MLVNRRYIKHLISESVRKVVRESFIVNSPKNKDGEETLLLRHTAGLIIQHLKKLHTALPEDLQKVLGPNNQIVNIKKSDKKSVHILLGLATAPGRSMTVLGKKTLSNNKDFFKGQFLELCQSTDFYFSNDIQDLIMMGDKVTGAFLSGSAHGRTYDHIFIASIFRKMNLIPPKGYFPSFSRPGDNALYMYVNRTKEEIEQAFNSNIKPFILSLFSLDESDLDNAQDIKYESKVSSEVTIEDLQDFSLGYFADAARLNNFYDLLKLIKDDHIHQRLREGVMSNIKFSGNPVAKVLHSILNDYYKYVKSYENDFEFSKEAESAGLDIAGFKFLLEQKLEIVNQYMR